MRPVAARYLHDRVRGATGWALGVLALVLSTAALYPSIKGQRSFEETFNNLPQGVRALFGAEGALAITSAPGYLHARLFAALLPVLLLIFGIGVGVAAIAGSEEDGTLEFLLANPISRRRVVAGRYVAVVALVATVTAVAALTLLAVAPVFGLFDRTTPWRLAVATAASGLLALLHASLGFALGCALGRRSVALGATTAVAVAGYFLQWVGHRVEGNDVGEFIPVKKLLGLPYVSIAPQFQTADADPSPTARG